MTSKIFKSMVLAEIVILLLSAAVFLFSLDHAFRERAVEELRVQAYLAADGVMRSGREYLEEVSLDTRITWITADGEILFDSGGATENHSDREEILAAWANGEGNSHRYSDTLGCQCIYYAVRLSDGSVLRMACEEAFVRGLVFSMSKHMIWILVLMIYGSLALALHVAKRIAKPLENLSLDNLYAAEIYTELQPLTDRLREQKRTIRDQMDELLDREREFAAITENMQEGFLLLNANGGVMSYNHSGGIVLDPVEAEAGRLVISEDFSQLQAAVNLSLLGQHWEGLQEYNHRVYQCIVNPVISSGQVAGVVMFIMDATEKQLREQLRREFSANVSHELKTPLTSISGFAELMMNGMVPPKKMQEFAGDIYKQSQQLIHLVGDIIQLSHLDEGRPVTLERVNLCTVMEQVRDRLLMAAEQYDVSLRVRCKPCEIDGVHQIVDEMLYNLCDNAIKYNVPGGSVTVTIRPEGNGALVSVADTGIGIPYEEQERVFERFYRVNKSHSKEIGGTGLGLSIVKHGAQFHGAELSMKSAPGKGTTVYIRFKNEP